MARHGILIDVGRCIGCYGCVVACKNWHKIKAGVGARRRLADIQDGDYPLISRWIFPVSCMQCDNAPCIEVCPTGASFRRKDGIVTIEKNKCIGCEACIEACPYGARYMNAETGKADGCDFCTDRVDAGIAPYCVESCAGEAMVFGDLDNPMSDISRRIKETHAVCISPEYNTKPKVYYAHIAPQMAAKAI